MSSKKVPRQSEKTRVCIVGAGSVGVYAAREALKQGWEPTVYETAPMVGGVWRSGHHWDSLTTNSSSKMMEVGDFPFPFQTSSEFPTRVEICKYVEAYAASFTLTKYIVFGTTVKSIEPVHKEDPMTKWVVRTTAERSPIQFFDVVFCATGQYNVPSLPACLVAYTAAAAAGRKRTRSSAQVLHSSQFRSGDIHARGKNVLVLGLGNSALDIALEAIESNAKRVIVACRQGSLMLPIRADDGSPMDKAIVTRLFEYMQPKQLRAYRTMKEAFEVTKVFESHGMPKILDQGINPLHLRVSNLKEKEKWIKYVKNGQVMFHSSGDILSLENNKVLFEDGSCLNEIDVIVACTGYKTGGHDTFKYLPKIILDGCCISYKVPISSNDNVDKERERPVTTLCLHRRTMHPIYPTLCFLAQVQTFGNEAVVGGFQARWAVCMLSQCSRVTKPLTFKGIQDDVVARKTFLFKNTPFHQRLHDQFLSTSR